MHSHSKLQPWRCVIQQGWQTHTARVDIRLNDTMCIIPGTMRSTLALWLPVLANISPTDLRQAAVEDNLIFRVKEHEDCHCTITSIFLMLIFCLDYQFGKSYFRPTPPTGGTKSGFWQTWSSRHWCLAWQSDYWVLIYLVAPAHSLAISALAKVSMLPPAINGSIQSQTNARVVKSSYLTTLRSHVHWRCLQTMVCKWFTLMTIER